MLKADIDSGATGDKVEHYDVGMAQLGTCEEAGGTPPSPERLARARKTAAENRPRRPAGYRYARQSWGIPTYIGFIVSAAVIVSGASGSPIDAVPAVFRSSAAPTLTRLP
jgi:hypothetical protein